MIVEFDIIPKESRIWIYQSKSDFTQSDIEIIKKKSEIFLDKWIAHNK